PSGGLLAAPDGLIVEPFRGPARQAPASPAPGTQTLSAYCSEFGKVVPLPGTMYRVAPPATQEKFKALRYLVRAANQLAEQGLLHPDTNPKSYGDFVKQYAIWSRLEGWDAQKFAQALVE